MRPKKLLSLCQFSYYDLPEYYIAALRANGEVPLKSVARDLLRLISLGVIDCGTYLSSAKDALLPLTKSALMIIGYENDNQKSGFVGYALRAPSGETAVSIRGSESVFACAPNNIDWRDNLCAPFSGSLQYAPATRFLDRFPEGALIVTGHSKGGNVAIKAQTGAKNPLARAVAFNAQGYGPGEFTVSARRRAKNGAVNYVIAGDLIGALLFHPETRVFVEGKPGVNAHSPEAYIFDAAGFPIPAKRTIPSIALDALSKAVVFYDFFMPSGILGGILRVITDRILRCPARVPDS